MIVKEAFIRCDSCGGVDSRHGVDEGAAVTRRHARAEGFVRRSTIWADEPWDLCPRCDANERAAVPADRTRRTEP